jgi:hypothetical protein
MYYKYQKTKLSKHIFGCERNEACGQSGILQTKELCDFVQITIGTRTIRSRMFCRSENVRRLKGQKCVQNKPPGIPRNKLEDDKKIDLRTVLGVGHKWN